MFYKIHNPTESLIEALWSEELKTFRDRCPDCATKINEKHFEGCDVARCTNCGGQRLDCGCEEDSWDIWTGIWPGLKEAYEQKLVCFDTSTMSVKFDLNEVAKIQQKEG